MQSLRDSKHYVLYTLAPGFTTCRLAHNECKVRGPLDMENEGSRFIFETGEVAWPSGNKRPQTIPRSGTKPPLWLPIQLPRRRKVLQWLMVHATAIFSIMIANEFLPYHTGRWPNRPETFTFTAWRQDVVLPYWLVYA